MFHQPFTDIQVSQACVALTSDLEITAANVTCARNHAVLFVWGHRQWTPIAFDTGATTNVLNDPANFTDWERKGDCGAIDGLTGQTRIKGMRMVQWTFWTKSKKFLQFQDKSSVCSRLQYQVIKSTSCLWRARKRFFSDKFRGSSLYFFKFKWTDLFQTQHEKTLTTNWISIQRRRCWRIMSITSLCHQSGKSKFNKATSWTVEVSFQAWALPFRMDTVTYATKESRWTAHYKCKASWIFQLQASLMHHMSVRKAN